MQTTSAGTLPFTAGTRLGPAHVGVLASLGIQTPLVHPRPAVGVLSTGNELAPAGATLGPGRIRDANRPALLAQLGSDGFRPVDLGMAGDDEVALPGILLAAASRCDAIVASGGVSVGDHDVLKVVLARLGGTSMRSLDIAVRPGKHVAFETDLPRRLGPRLDVLRVRARIGPGGALLVRPSGGQDSHMLRAMAGANALALLPDGDGVRAGGRVEVLLLDAEQL